MYLASYQLFLLFSTEERIISARWVVLIIWLCQPSLSPFFWSHPINLVVSKGSLTLNAIRWSDTHMKLNSGHVILAIWSLHVLLVNCSYTLEKLILLTIKLKKKEKKGCMGVALGIKVHLQGCQRYIVKRWAIRFLIQYVINLKFYKLQEI